VTGRLDNRAARITRAAFVVVALLGSGWTSCFFEPRDPEVGDALDTTATQWRPANTPGDLVRNIEVTFEDRQIVFYERAFSTIFLFRADPQDSIDEANQGSNVFQNWDKARESAAAEKIFEEWDRITLTLSDLSPPDSQSQGDQVRLRKDYAFSIVKIDSSGPVPVTSDSAFYKGTLTLYMSVSDGAWRVDLWEDTRLPGIPSWGNLRAESSI
jgi:hypothetical protein